ncbi:HAD hydrolase family protein [Nocardia goodfellowii]|uniref:Phosphoserine phosphatase n=1 Tax=Nocardia goodfellowii TaxID=882446 RepID=A0ABS4QDA8_9NOCA|nr:HAD hydrolase family protein [Nocardia goodfellowii]MBP2189670.1 phosphoserine phosphatase [Nocardia goodfellowii]
MTIRYAALDLDGTLIDGADQPYEGVIAGLESLREQGVLPLLVTGRSACSFRTLRHLDDLFDLFDDQVLLSEGNVRLARDADALTFLQTSPHEVLRRLTAAPGIDLVAEWSGELHATTARAAMQFAMAYRVPRRQIAVTTSVAEINARPTAVTVFGSCTPVRELVMGLDCEVIQIRPFDAQVVRPCGTGKAAALVRHMLWRFGEPDLSRTLAVGDGAGDAGMLSACAMSAATHGADPAAAAAAAERLQGDLASFLRDFHPEGKVRP